MTVPFLPRVRTPGTWWATTSEVDRYQDPGVHPLSTVLFGPVVKTATWSDPSHPPRHTRVTYLMGEVNKIDCYCKHDIFSRVFSYSKFPVLDPLRGRVAGPCRRVLGLPFSPSLGTSTRSKGPTVATPPGGGRRGPSSLVFASHDSGSGLGASDFVSK